MSEFSPKMNLLRFCLGPGRLRHWSQGDLLGSPWRDEGVLRVKEERQGFKGLKEERQGYREGKITMKKEMAEFRERFHIGNERNGKHKGDLTLSA